MKRDPRTNPKPGDLFYLRPLRNANIRVEVELVLAPDESHPFAICLSLRKLFRYSAETWRELAAGAETA